MTKQQVQDLIDVAVDSLTSIRAELRALSTNPDLSERLRCHVIAPLQLTEHVINDLAHTSDLIDDDPTRFGF